VSRNVVILGNSGAARECYWLLREVMKKENDLTFRGFLAFEGYDGDLRELSDLALGSDDTYAPAPDDEFIIGIGLPALRLKAYHKWSAQGARFMNLVHPSVTLVGNPALGKGNILAQGVYISCDTRLGNANYLNGSVVLGHDTSIGDGNFFGPFAVVLGDVRIGSGNSFGVHSVVLAGAKIGNNNTIAPGAYVYKGCGDESVMAGNPAMNIG
jgi:sugar O-acyltransferase (sialic acid O-acetyltransferase NeuD family)